MTELEKKVCYLEGCLIAHRAFVSLALSRPIIAQARKEFQKKLILQSVVDTPEATETAELIFAGYNSEQAALRAVLNKTIK